MAGTSNGSINLNFVNATWVAPSVSNGSFLGTPANYMSIAALRSRLGTVNAGYYTTAKLDQMTVNDMVFALRSIDDRTTIADYMPVSTA